MTTLVPSRKIWGNDRDRFCNIEEKDRPNYFIAEGHCLIVHGYSQSEAHHFAFNEDFKVPDKKVIHVFNFNDTDVGILPEFYGASTVIIQHCPNLRRFDDSTKNVAILVISHCPKLTSIGTFIGEILHIEHCGIQTIENASCIQAANISFAPIAVLPPLPYCHNLKLFHLPNLTEIPPVPNLLDLSISQLPQLNIVPEIPKLISLFVFSLPNLHTMGPLSHDCRMISNFHNIRDLEEDCPICFESLTLNRKLYWCRQCRRGIHALCFLRCERCPLCRAHDLC